MRQPTNWPKAPLVLLALLILYLYVLQYAVLPRYDHLPLISASFFDFKMALLTWGEIRWFDAPLLGLSAVFVVALIALEVRTTQVTRLLTLVLRSNRTTWAALAIATFVSTRYYFASGESHWAGDASAHMAYAYAAARAIADGQWPLWTNLMGVGTPYLQYYGFLYFYLVGLINLISGDFFSTIKLSLAFGHWLSAAGMYLLARTACRSRAAGLLAALAYTLSFWHVQQVLHMGRFPLSLFYGLLPWPFYFFERLRTSHQRAHLVLAGAISLGALAFTHPGYGFWGTLFFALYAGARFIQEPRSRPLFVSTALMLLGAVLFGAYLTLPMWLERSGTGLAQGISLAGVVDPSWKRIFIWSNLRFPALPLSLEETAWYGGYIGNSLFVLGLAGSALALRRARLRRHLPYLSIGLCLALSLLLVFAYRWAPLQALPVVTALNSGRYLLFVCFFAALFAGVGAATLRRWRPLTARGRVLLFPLLLVLIDLGPTTLQQPFTKAVNNPTYYPLDIIEELQTEGEALDLAAGELPNYRLFTNLADMHIFLATTWLMCRTDLPTPQADHRHILSSMSAFVGPFERYLNYLIHHFEADEDEESVTQRIDIARAGLQLLNARHLLDTHEENGVLTLTNAAATPIIVAPTLAPFPALPNKSVDEDHISYALKQQPENTQLQTLAELFPVAQLIADMELGTSGNRSARIFVPDVEPSSFGTEPSAEVISHRVWHQRVEMQVQISAACYARLA